jgi:phenylpyruvate tautomerase PptA (4-oxalocrotonate tautomerase family)
MPTAGGPGTVRAMPMIDVSPAPSCAGRGCRTSRLFADNTAGFIHHLPDDAICDAAGAGDHVRVQVLTPAGVLDRDKQLGVVKELTEIVAAAGDPTLAERTRVLITESPDGGWGIAGHANTRADIAASARGALAGR